MRRTSLTNRQKELKARVLELNVYKIYSHTDHATTEVVIIQDDR